MTTTTIILVAVVVAVALIAMLASRGAGPRVTTIEHTREKRDEEGQE